MLSRRECVRVLAAILMAGALLSRGVVLASTPFELQNDIEGIIRDAGVGSTEVSVTVLDPDADITLAAINADELMIPASNMKLLSSGGALVALGSEFVFKTRIIWSPENGGTLIVQGDGDPAFGDPVLLMEQDRGVEDFLGAMVNAVVDAGINQIGELVIDDRIFDRTYVHPSWPREQLNRWYCAEVAGLNFHTNLIRVFTHPEDVGRPPVVALEPEAPWLTVVNSARSVKSGSHTAWVARRLTSNAMTLRGDVRYASDPVEVALHEPTTFFGELLQARLREVGLGPERVRLADPEESAPEGRTILIVETPIETALRRCNVNSYNLYAEALIKRLGHEVTGMPGSWSNGAASLRLIMLDRLGAVTSDHVRIADGSGMSRENRVTTALLASWLQSFHLDADLREPFVASLATTGPKGTLRKRFRTVRLENEIRAKTGYLSGVTALSGYMIHPATDRRIVFSIITNDKPAKVALSTVRLMEERIAERVDEWLSAQ
ncbi:MAG: D-alanyl-D-alanine carboxypeptidase/D-alanyl-D-alanine-endopeptidase [Phycisphaerales bacterium]